MAEIRKIEIDREFIVKLKGKVSTKELAEIFDNLHEAIKEVICNNIVDDGVVSVEPVKRGVLRVLCASSRSSRPSTCGSTIPFIKSTAWAC